MLICPSTPLLKVHFIFHFSLSDNFSGDCKHRAKLYLSFFIHIITQPCCRKWIAPASTKFSGKWFSGSGWVTISACVYWRSCCLASVFFLFTFHPCVIRTLRLWPSRCLFPVCISMVVAICPPLATLLLRLLQSRQACVPAAAGPGSSAVWNLTLCCGACWAPRWWESVSGLDAVRVRLIRGDFQPEVLSILRQKQSIYLYFWGFPFFSVKSSFPKIIKENKSFVKVLSSPPLSTDPISILSSLLCISFPHQRVKADGCRPALGSLQGFFLSSFVASLQQPLGFISDWALWCLGMSFSALWIKVDG